MGGGYWPAYLFLRVICREPFPKHSRINSVGPCIHKEPIQILIFDGLTHVLDRLLHLRDHIRPALFSRALVGELILAAGERGVSLASVIGILGTRCLRRRRGCCSQHKRKWEMHCDAFFNVLLLLCYFWRRHCLLEAQCALLFVM